MRSFDSPVFTRRFDAPPCVLSRALEDLAAARVSRLGPHEVEATFPLPIGAFRRAVPVRLLLSWSDARRLTLAELVPERSGAGGRAYFQAGNRLLDALARVAPAEEVAEAA